MSISAVRTANRRRFLQFLAGSPVLAAAACSGNVRELLGAIAQERPRVSNPEDAINVFDFESIVRETMPPAHYGYMASGSDDDLSIELNREGFTKFAIRPRRLINVSQVDTSIELFGERLPSPITLAPLGGQRMFHPDGELAAARAARVNGHLQILSTMSGHSVEEVTEARGGPVWYQLYPQGSIQVARALIERAEAAGSTVIVLTIDLLAGRNMETSERYARLDTRDCNGCHDPQNPFSMKPMINGLPPDVAATMGPNTVVDWAFVRQLRDIVQGRLLIKGVESGEDAVMAVHQIGLDGVIVSNHGGRAGQMGRGTIESLSEVLAAVASAAPVLIDGGFRRGTDVFKALALGATAISIGRPYVWGMGAFGQPGVERVLEIMDSEFRRTMQQAGTTSIAQINPTYITPR
jgi:4-hydroxymandelate oxidase